MPEGHTIHALAERLERVFGRSVVSASSPQGRFSAGAELLDGRVLQSAEARGKHLFVDFEVATVHVHLGLIGTFHVKPKPLPVPASPPSGGRVSSTPANPGSVRLRLENESHVAELRGPMICTLVDAPRRAEIEARLGPDPLDPSADPEQGWLRLSRSRKSVAELLMEQAVVAGVGNVYRCEVLFRHRVDPATPGNDLGKVLWDRIWADLVGLMTVGVAFGQILTMPDQVDDAATMMADGSSAPITRSLTGERLGDYFERRFNVYKRTGEPCLRCGRRVRSGEAAGRTLYWCPGCQTRRKR